MVRQLIALKAKITWNTLTRQLWVLVMVILGLLNALSLVVGLVVAVVAAIFSGFSEITLALLTLGGSAVVLGWWLVPAMFSGIDNTLDPERFAPYVEPSPRFALGLVAATGVGVAGVLTTLLTLLPALGWALAGKFPAATAAVLAVPLALLTAFTWARALTTWIGTRLRATSTRRDLSAAVSTTLFILVVAPAGVWIQWLVRDFDPETLKAGARVAAWMPFGAAFGVPAAIDEGDWLAAGLRLVIALVTLGVGFWLWQRVLVDAMAGVAGRVSPQAVEAIAAGRRLVDPSKEPAGPSQAQDGARPVTRAGEPEPLRRVEWWQAVGLSAPSASMAARTARYWLRDARLMVSLMSPLIVLVLAVVWEAMPEIPSAMGLFMVFFMPVAQGSVIGILAQYDSTALWTSVSSPLNGRQERMGRLAGSLPVTVALMLVCVLGYTLLTRRDVVDLALLSSMVIALLFCSAVMALVIGSVWVFPVQPPGVSPMSMRGTGEMMTTMLVQTADLFAAAVVGLPVIVSTALSLADVVPVWVGPLVSLPWSVLVVVIGVGLAGSLWDRNKVGILTRIRSWPGH